DPDVLILQEIPLESTDRHQQFVNGLKKLGYKNFVYRHSEEDSSMLGVMMASKLDLKFEEKLELGYRRIALVTKLNLGIKTLTIIGTHLEVTEKSVRREQVEMILAYIDKNHSKVLLAGDFNDRW